MRHTRYNINGKVTVGEELGQIFELAQKCRQLQYWCQAHCKSSLTNTLMFASCVSAKVLLLWIFEWSNQFSSVIARSRSMIITWNIAPYMCSFGFINLSKLKSLLKFEISFRNILSVLFYFFYIFRIYSISSMPSSTFRSLITDFICVI